MSFSLVSAEEVNTYIGKKNVLLIDLRERSLYNKSHIHTAINIPYENLSEKEHYLSSFSILIFYCERGNSSLMAGRRYQNLSPRVLSLAGGFYRNKDKFMIDGRDEIIHNK